MQSPSFAFVPHHTPGVKVCPRVILVRTAATVSSEGNMLPTSSDEPVSSLGEVQAMKLGEFLMDAHVDDLLVSPAERAVFTASQVAKCQSLTGDRAPRLQLMDDLTDISIGAFSGRAAVEVSRAVTPHSLCACVQVMRPHGPCTACCSRRGLCPDQGQRSQLRPHHGAAASCAACGIIVSFR